MIVLQSIDWAAVAKTWGPLGLVFIIALVGTVATAKWVRGLLTDTIADARKERDRMAVQLDKRDDLILKQAQEFSQSLRYRDDKFREVADAIERVGRRK